MFLWNTAVFNDTNNIIITITITIKTFHFSQTTLKFTYICEMVKLNWLKNSDEICSILLKHSRT